MSLQFTQYVRAWHGRPVDEIMPYIAVNQGVGQAKGLRFRKKVKDKTAIKALYLGVFRLAKPRWLDVVSTRSARNILEACARSSTG